jgi:DNA-binding CsgD family transcriptional regulator
MEILELLANGFSTKKIASILYIEVETVRSHLKGIYGKLQVNKALEAAAVYWRSRPRDLTL